MTKDPTPRLDPKQQTLHRGLSIEVVTVTAAALRLAVGALPIEAISLARVSLRSGGSGAKRRFAELAACALRSG
ncbi:MAG TPA: hypothetical protein VN805_02725 [Caulobacteraceae bacterium]|nr:hypothetical protein [Caulobacteraceae bacterium]